MDAGTYNPIISPRGSWRKLFTFTADPALDFTGCEARAEIRDKVEGTELYISSINEISSLPTATSPSRPTRPTRSRCSSRPRPPRPSRPPRRLSGTCSSSGRTTRTSSRCSRARSSSTTRSRSRAMTSVIVEELPGGLVNVTMPSDIAVTIELPSDPYPLIEVSAARGAQGIQGIQGIPGIQGQQGIQGLRGLTGPAGGSTFHLPVQGQGQRHHGRPGRRLHHLEQRHPAAGHDPAHRPDGRHRPRHLDRSGQPRG